MMLDQLSFLEKKSAFEDFQWSPESPPPPAEVDRLAGEWLQAHIESNNPVTAVAQRVGDEHWLLRCADEEGTDNSGRRLYRLTAGRLLQPPDPDRLVRALLGAFQNEMASFVPCSGPLPESDPVEPAGAARQLESAVLTLASGASSFAVIADPGGAVRALELLGLDLLEFVALFPRRLPPRLPGRCGLFVSEAPWLFPLAVAELDHRIPDLSLLLAKLGELPTRPAQRRKILRLLLDLPEETLR